MAITFNEVPANLRIPGIYVEIDGAGAAAGLGDQPYEVLVLGQKLAAAPGAVNTPTRVTSASQAASLFGAGSMIHGMVKQLIRNNRWIPIWVVAMADPGAGAAAAGSLDFAVTTAEAGTIPLMVGARRVQVGVAAGDTATAIAAATVSAINGLADCPISATVNGGDDTIVDLTCRHAGTIGNELDVRVNHFDGEALPGGVTVAITAMTGGTGTPDLTSAIAAVPDEQYLVWLAPYTDASVLTELETELQDRWGPTRRNGGVAFTASAAAHSSVAAIGSARNSEHVSILGSHGIPNPVWEVAAAVAGTVGESAAIDPARPFQTLELDGLLAPKPDDRWTDTERSLLLYDGIATARVAPGSKVVLERVITTYQQNDLGADDIALMDVNSVLTVERLRYDLRQRIALKYPRHKLGDDGKNYGPGQAIVTPTVMKAEIIALFREWEEKAWVEALEQFAQDLIVERNATDPNRLDIRMSPDLVNQLRVVGAQISFIL